MNRAATGAASDAASYAGDAADAADGAAAAAAGALVVGAPGAGGRAGAEGGAGTGDTDGERPAASGRANRTGSDDGDWSGDGSRVSSGEHHPDDLARRNPPRDWAAPPPWLASAERPRDVDADPPPFLGRRTTEPGQGLVGSPADRMAGGPLPARHDAADDGMWSSDSRTAAAAGAGLAGGVAPARRPALPPDAADDDEDEEEIRRPVRRPRAYAQHLGGPDGPDWEHPRRYEAYPTIKARVGLSAVPRIVGLLGLVVVLALALFLLPGILNIGGSAPPAGPSPKASAVTGPSSSLTPTTPPEPTPGVYTIKKGETLSKIATAHGITIEELLAANPTIKNPNKISEGQQIVIPVPSDAPPDTVGESAAP